MAKLDVWHAFAQGKLFCGGGGFRGFNKGNRTTKYTCTQKKSGEMRVQSKALGMSRIFYKYVCLYIWNVILKYLRFTTLRDML